MKNKNNSQHNKYLRLLIISILLLIGTLRITSIVVDPYKVFGLTNFNQKNFSPNTRYLDIEYLLKNHEHNAFILGSSRVNFYDINSANTLSKHKYYNMSASAENLRGMKNKLQWLIKNQTVKQIILAIDYDTGLEQYDALDLLRQDHPLITNQSRPQFLLKYVLVQPQLIFKVIQSNLSSKSEFFFDVSTGQFKWPSIDSLMQRKPKAYLATEFPSFKEALTASLKEGELQLKARENPLQDLKEIVKLIQTNKLNAIFIINPYNQHFFQSFDINCYTKWIKDVVDICGQVWNFSGINSVTTRDELYYEWSHFTSSVGDLVLSKIFDDILVKDISDNFGVLVNQENIDSHLKRIYEEYFVNQKV